MTCDQLGWLIRTADSIGRAGFIAAKDLGMQGDDVVRAVGRTRGF